MLIFCLTSTILFGTDDEILDSLLLRVREKDMSALEELYTKTKSGIFGFALSILKSHCDAEEVLHNCYLSVWASAHLYTSQGKPMAWLITIAKHHCYKILKNRKWNTNYDNDKDTEAYSYDFTQTEDEKWVLSEYLKELSNDERQIIMLHSVAGFKHREISEFLNLPIATVLSKYHRGLKKLKEKYNKGGAL